MKKINYLLSLVACITLPLSLVNAQEHSNTTYSTEHKASVIDLREFNMKRANFIMDSLHIQDSERAGYLKFLKNQWIQKRYPAYDRMDEGDKPYVNYKPQRDPHKSVYCANAGFELFDFSSWLPSYGTYGSPATFAGAVSTVMNAATSDAGARHTITTTPPTNNNPSLGPIVGYDPNAVHPVSGLAEIELVAPSGTGVSCRLGNAVNGAQSEQLVYPITVTTSNTQFYYQFAIVLENPVTGHLPTEQPYFQITVKDSTGAAVGGVCGIYNVNSSLALTDTSFVNSSAGVSGYNVFYRKWELVGIDLSALIGQTVTIEFVTADCKLSGHFGYAYIDADCGSTALQTSFCASDLFATIVAPPGFISYQWYGPNSMTPIAGGTNDTLIINPPTLLDTFYVILESTSGCISSLSTVLNFTSIGVSSFSVTNSCLHGNTGSVTVFPTGSSSGYTYLWSTGDTTQTVTGLAAGNYTIHIESAGGSCGIIDTTIAVGSNPVFANLANVPYCDPLFIYMTGPAGSAYQWYNMAGSPLAANDTLGVTSPTAGMQFILAYDLPSGCRDSIVYTLTASTLPGIFSSSPGSCGAMNLNYTGAGPFTYTTTGPGGYNNSSGSTSAATYPLTGLLPGTYTATLNAGGCTNTLTFTITLSVSTANNTLKPCQGDNVTLTNATVGVHNWYNPSGVLITSGASGTLLVPGILEGTYVDTVVTGSACLQVTNYNIIYDSIVATPGAIQNFCYEDSDGILTMVIMHNPPAGSVSPVISWTGPGGYTGTGTPQTSLATGPYNWTITSGNCTLSGSININGPSAPPDTLRIVTEVCMGNPSAILVAPAGFSNYQWYFNNVAISGVNNDSIVITNTDDYLNYYVTYDIPPYGCNRRTTLIFNDKPDPLFLPDLMVNIFTPNGDGENDKFYPFIAPFLTPEQLKIVTYNYKISIYNRWGELMYETDDYLAPWDGKKNGNPCDEGVYFWRLDYTPRCANEGQDFDLNGTIHLER